MRDWQAELEFRFRHLVIPLPHRTILFGVAGDFQEMAGSYLSDGNHFFSIDDIVNAIASWSYALGWLDAGCSLGLFRAPVHEKRWLFAEIVIPAGEHPHLQEKTHRYQNLLSTALESVEPAPEPDTPVHHAAERFILASALSREYGRCFLSLGKIPNSLGAFSYGHAWLDAGVRAALVRVTGSRGIFAV